MAVLVADCQARRVPGVQEQEHSADLLASAPVAVVAVVVVVLPMEEEAVNNTTRRGWFVALQW